MTSGAIQKCLAAIFLLLGGWCLTMPALVESLVFRPEFQHGTATTKILLGCFGAQAMLAGLLIYTTRFEPRSFLIFGVFASVPFFIFNYYFYFVEKIFTDWMLLDFVGNIAILALCILGYRKSRSIAD